MSGTDARHPSDPGRDGRGAGRARRDRIGRQRARSPEPVDPPDPVNLAELSELLATDALLDRYGRRQLSDQDAADPLGALLAGLTRDVDLETDASRRFRAVLAGRTAQDGRWRDEPVAVGPVAVGPGMLGTGRAAAHRRGETQPRGWASRVVRALPVTGAAAGVLLAFGAGLLAAVTGDPLAPITTLDRALSPQTEPVSFIQVQRTINKASAAVSAGRMDRARQLIDSAKRALDTVPAQQVTDLKGQISQVEKDIAEGGGVPVTATAPVPTGAAPTDLPTGAPEPDVTGTSAPTGGSTVTDPPTPTVSDPDPPTGTGTPSPGQSPTPTTSPPLSRPPTTAASN